MTHSYPNQRPTTPESQALDSPRNAQFRGEVSDLNDVHRVGYPFFAAAAVEFGRQSQITGALLAAALLGWALAAEHVLRHTTWTGPSVDQSGYATGLPQRDLDLLTQFERLSLFARVLTTGLGLLGPTLFVWALTL